jgi:hypothetical protein
MARRPHTARRQVSPAVTVAIVAGALIVAAIAIWLGTRGPETRTAERTPEFNRLQQKLHDELRAHPEQMRVTARFWVAALDSVPAQPATASARGRSRARRRSTTKGASAPPGPQSSLSRGTLVQERAAWSTAA